MFGNKWMVVIFGDFFFFLTKSSAESTTQIHSNKKESIQKEKWDISQTFSKGGEPKVGHSQHIFNHFLSN